MKTTLLLIILLVTLGVSYTQETQDTSAIKIIPYPEIEAQFPGGTDAYRKYIKENLIYPDNYMEIDKKGKIFASFFVNSDGTISEVKIERGLGDMVKNLILGMPKWVPAKMDGKATKSRKVVAITVDLE
jgi:protein TonB